MKHEDAVTIAGILSDVITSRRGEALFPEGKEGTPSNLGVIWITEIMKVPDEDTELATQAVIDLMVKTTRRPEPLDFHERLKLLKHNQRMSMPGLPEPDYTKELPPWVKGWMIAFSKSDNRAWPEQRSGFDYLQRSNPHYRTYIWSEQDDMPEEDRRRYMEEGRHLTNADFQEIFLKAKIISKF